MAVGLIGWGRVVDAEGNRTALPAGLWALLHGEAKDLSRFAVVQLPPASIAQGGSGAGCDGYEVFEYRNLDGTRYGSKEELMAAIAALHANGVQVYGDLPFHQMGGENGGPGVFRYNGRRGETIVSWFQGGFGTTDPIPPFVKQDDIPSTDGDYPFGRPRSYQNSIPAGVVEADAKDILALMDEWLGMDGWRWDDVKATHAPSVARIMATQPKLPFYGEYFDGNPALVNAWATQAPMNSRSGVEDFTLHWRIQAACNGYDATQFDRDGAGYWQWNSSLAVGFVDNPDTDTSPGQQVIFNKGIAYAYMLTLPLHLALVYGKDYYPSSPEWPGAYGLKTIIDNLVWVSRMFAVGAYQVRYVDKDVHVATRDGNGGPLGWSGGLLTALNFNTLTPRTVTVETTFGANAHLHDYTGHHEDIWTDGEGRATFTIPSNAYSGGQSYLCFAPAGVNKALPVASLSTTQTFVGASDLFTTQAKSGVQTLAQRLYVSRGTRVHLAMTANLQNASTIVATVNEADGTPVSMQRIGAGPSAFANETKTTGWHSVSIEGFSLPTDGVDFKLAVTYTGAHS